MASKAERTTACVGIGSNIAPETNIPAALELLAGHGPILALSTFYWTPPLGGPGQPEYLNGVCVTETSRSPRELKFGVLRSIEQRLRRDRSAGKWAPRTIDLDLLLYGDRAVEEPDLVIPDPDIRSRPFLALSLLEVAPELIMPDTGLPLAIEAGSMDREGMKPDEDFSRRLNARFTS